MNNLLHEYQIGVEFPDVSGAEFLDLLSIRDELAQIQINLTEKEQTILTTADQLLIKNCGLICEELSRFINLSDYRAEKQIKPHQWWWYLDVLVYLPQGTQFSQKIVKKIADPRQKSNIAPCVESRQKNDQLITSNYVISELVALFDSPLRVPLPQLFQYIDAINTTSYITLIHVDLDVHNQAWQLLKNRPDKNWSLVDATSFAIMTQWKLSQGLTTDRHFEQAGFIRILNN